MKIVVDTNRLIAALIKDGASRKILRNPTHEFFTPAFAFEEIWEHKDEIARKAGLNEQELVAFPFIGKDKGSFSRQIQRTFGRSHWNNWCYR